MLSMFFKDNHHNFVLQPDLKACHDLWARLSKDRFIFCLHRNTIGLDFLPLTSHHNWAFGWVSHQNIVLNFWTHPSRDFPWLIVVCEIYMQETVSWKDYNLSSQFIRENISSVTFPNCCFGPKFCQYQGALVSELVKRSCTFQTVWKCYIFAQLCVWCLTNCLISHLTDPNKKSPVTG